MAVEYERMMGAIEYGAPTEMVERRMVSVAVDDLGPPLVCAARCGRADVIALLRARGAKCPPEAMIVAITEDNAAVIAAAKDDFEDLHPFFLMAENVPIVGPMGVPVNGINTPLRIIDATITTTY
jgi:hypothetical protein